MGGRLRPVALLVTRRIGFYRILKELRSAQGVEAEGFGDFSTLDMAHLAPSAPESDMDSDVPL